MLQSMSPTIINEFLGKRPIGIFFMKASYIMFFDAFSEIPGIKDRLIN